MGSAQRLQEPTAERLSPHRVISVDKPLLEEFVSRHVLIHQVTVEAKQEGAEDLHEQSVEQKEPGPYSHVAEGIC